jgi:hypothetical protein
VEIKSHVLNPHCADIFVDGQKLSGSRSLLIEVGHLPVATIEVLCVPERNSNRIVIEKPKSSLCNERSRNRRRHHRRPST